MIALGNEEAEKIILNIDFINGSLMSINLKDSILKMCKVLNMQYDVNQFGFVDDYSIRGEYIEIQCSKYKQDMKLKEFGKPKYVKAGYTEVTVKFSDLTEETSLIVDDNTYKLLDVARDVFIINDSIKDDSLTKLDKNVYVGRYLYQFVVRACLTEEVYK